jgi:hypothetical protein
MDLNSERRKGHEVKPNWHGEKPTCRRQGFRLRRGFGGQVGAASRELTAWAVHAEAIQPYFSQK